MNNLPETPKNEIDKAIKLMAEYYNEKVIK
jgi:hypothetical protein